VRLSDPYPVGIQQQQKIQPAEVLANISIAKLAIFLSYDY